MRLIRTTPPIQVDEFPENEVAKLEYAILSHRWEENEVSFQEMLGPTDATRDKKGYKKIEKFCERALNEGFKYAWVDTCCINKESSAELSEAINSMFRWYRDAAKCYAFLTDVDPRTQDNFLLSVWFTRGWTLQELIAPRKLVFLANDWSEIGPRQVLAPEISQTTKIDKALLLGQKSLYEFSIAKRMSWAAGRETTRAEDRAYSLMGIFRVYMPLLYGEGDNAFIRLQEEIMKDSSDETLFAWERDGISEDNPSGLLAPSPDCFVKSGGIVPCTVSEGGLPFALTNRGIRLESPLIPPSSSTTTLIFQCTENSALVGIGIKLNQNSAADEFVRITETLVRDIPPCLLQNSLLETTYIPKSVMVTSAQIPNPQGRDSFATSEIGSDPENSNLFHRKIKPRGNFKRIILLFDDEPALFYSKQESGAIRPNLRALQDMLVRKDGSQIVYYDSWKHNRNSLRIWADGFDFIDKNYGPGDEIALFGFGRGCYPLLELFDINKKSLRVPIRFLGLFDAFYHASKSDLWRTSWAGSASCVVRHAIGIDEKQIVLKPILGDGGLTGCSDFQEIWFSGGHQDIGGTAKWAFNAAQHVPLHWMEREAEKMGLHLDSSLKGGFGGGCLGFDIPLFNLDYKGCSTSLQDLINRRERDAVGVRSRFEIMKLHSELEFGQGWRPGHVLKQRLKNLFFSKTLSQSTAQRRGQRQIPPNAIIHYSVMLQMREDPTYRPSNLCIQEPNSLYVLDDRDEIIEYALWKQRNDAQADSMIFSGEGVMDMNFGFHRTVHRLGERERED